MDAEGQIEVLEGDGVGGEAGELVGELREGGEVLLQGDVEGVDVFEVDGDFAALASRLGLVGKGFCLGEGPGMGDDSGWVGRAHLGVSR